MVANPGASGVADAALVRSRGRDERRRLCRKRVGEANGLQLNRVCSRDVILPVGEDTPCCSHATVLLPGIMRLWMLEVEVGAGGVGSVVGDATGRAVAGCGAAVDDGGGGCCGSGGWEPGIAGCCGWDGGRI